MAIVPKTTDAEGLCCFQIIDDEDVERTAEKLFLCHVDKVFPHIDRKIASLGLIDKMLPLTVSKKQLLLQTAINTR